jgi:hypothetical protein
MFAFVLDALLLGVLILFVQGRFGLRTFYGLGSAAMGLFLLKDTVLVPDTVDSLIAAVFLGIFLHLWWINGGGDNTKKRLRKWAKKFEGRRRTAAVNT